LIGRRNRSNEIRHRVHLCGAPDGAHDPSSAGVVVAGEMIASLAVAARAFLRFNDLGLGPVEFTACTCSNSRSSVSFMST